MTAATTALAALFLLGSARAASVPSPDEARKAAVARCASCHRSEHESWKAGPHANSYAKLLAHLEKVKDPDSRLPPLMRAALSRPAVTAECWNCHAPAGKVFEGFVPSEWDGGEPFAYEKMANAHGAPRLTGGSDCLTCHAQGNRVVTRHDYAPPKGFKPPKGFCDPLPSKSFSHIVSCAGCHEGQALAYADRFSIEPAKQVRPYVSCNECHMERAPSGKRTHYYYWKTGLRGGEHIPKSGFDGIALSVKKAGRRRELVLSWPLDFTPHPLVPNSYKMYTFRLEVLDERGAPAHSARFGLMALTNPREPEEAAAMLGKEGLELVVHNTLAAVEKTFPLPPEVGAAGAVRLTVAKRPRWWDEESTEVRLYQREDKYKP